MTRSCLGVLLALGAAGPAAQDVSPADFLNVKEWHGRLAVRVHGEGTREDRAGRVTRRYSVRRYAEVTFKIALDPASAMAADTAARALKSVPAGLPPEARRDLERLAATRLWKPEPGRQDQEVLLRVRDSAETFGQEAREGGGGPYFSSGTLLTGQAIHREPARASLRVDARAGTFDLSVDWTRDVPLTRTTWDTRPGSAPPDRFTGTVRAPSLRLADQPLPRSDLVLRGTLEFTRDVEHERPFTDFGFIHGELEWTLSPKPLDPVELEIRIPGYDSWLPEGPAAGADEGNRLEVHATLRTRGGGVPDDECERISFFLDEVSWEPGVAGNAPSAPAGEPRPDLRFSLRQKPGVVVMDLTGLRAVATRPGTTAVVEIRCFDWGAFGVLRAEARLKSGRIVDGFLAGGPRTPLILLPKRAEHSRIADAWKSSAGLPPDAPDEADEDADPPGNGFQGDGLTLYEEYRGFFEGARHIRTDPRRKDLFVVDRNGHPRVRAGLKLFAALSKLDVHSEVRPDQLRDRRVNFNSRTVKRVDQHGVIVDPFSDRPDEVAAAYGPGAGKARTTPKDYHGILISSKLLQLPSRALARPSGPRQGADPLEVAVAHELFHTVNVSHHGDPPGESVRWVIRRDPNGGWSMTEEGKPVRMVLEDGSPFPFTQEADVQANVGRPGGLYSGDEDCVMRYTNADAYVHPRDPAVRVNVRGDDAPGRSLCTSPRGTGINAPSWANGGRFKDAARGNCAGQIVVNDLFQ